MKVEDNLRGVFGSKFSNSLIKFNLKIDFNQTEESANGDAKDSSIASEASLIQSSVTSPSYEVFGFISKVGEGVGRNDNDRQFIFVNNRPVDLAKVTKVLNECWRRYEMKQKPAFVLNIIVPPGHLDVNLSPDKREVVILHEGLLLQRLREHVDNVYAPSRSTFKVGLGLVATHVVPMSDDLEETKSDRNALLPDAPSYTSNPIEIDAHLATIEDNMLISSSPQNEESTAVLGSDSAPTEVDTSSTERILHCEEVVSAWSFDVAAALEKFKEIYTKPSAPDSSSQLYSSPAKLLPADLSAEFPMASPPKVQSRVLSKKVG